MTGLDGFCDADWGTSDGCRSIAVNILRYNGARIAWKSKLQKTVALSAAGAEYYSASLGAVDVICLLQLLRDMGFESNLPTPVYEESSRTAQHVLSGPTIHAVAGSERLVAESERSASTLKHLAQEAAQLGYLRLRHQESVHHRSQTRPAPQLWTLSYLRLKRVSTTDRRADVFTKSLQPKQHVACMARLLRHPWKDSSGTSVLARGNVILRVSASSQSPFRPVRLKFTRGVSQSR